MRGLINSLQTSNRKRSREPRYSVIYTCRQPLNAPDCQWNPQPLPGSVRSVPPGRKRMFTADRSPSSSVLPRYGPSLPEDFAVGAEGHQQSFLSCCYETHISPEWFPKNMLRDIWGIQCYSGVENMGLWHHSFLRPLASHFMFKELLPFKQRLKWEFPTIRGLHIDPEVALLFL